MCNFFTECSDDEKPTTGNVDYHQPRDAVEKLMEDDDADEVLKDPDPAPISEIKDDPEDKVEEKEGEVTNDDQYVGQDSGSSGSETEVVVESAEEADPKEADNETTKQEDYMQPTIENQPEVDKSQEVVKPHKVDKSSEVDNGNDKSSVEQNRLRPDKQPNSEIIPYGGFCDGTRCQRPYTWYTTLKTYSNVEETESPPKVVLSDVAQNLKEFIDLTRSGRDVKKRRTKRKLRGHSKNHPKNAKRRISQKPSSKLRHRKDTKNIKRKKTTKSIKITKIRKN